MAGGPENGVHQYPGAARPETPPAVVRPPVSGSPDPGKEARLRHDLRLMTSDGLLFSIMVGAGEAYLGAFALAAGHSEVVAGWLASLPMLGGAILQLRAPRMVQRFGSLRRWVVTAAVVQALSFLPLVVAAATGYAPLWMLFGAAILYWAANLATGPAWNTWVTTLVPVRIRARYFAGRSRVTQIGTLLGLAAGGLTLQFWTGGSKAGGGTAAFAVLFGAAFVARLGASRCLAGQSEPERLPPDFRLVPIREFLHRRGGAGAKLLLYMLAVQVAVQISAPFFTPFMLGQLHLNYGAFMTLLGASFIGKMLALPLIGRIAQRVGPGRVLWIGGLGIIPLAAMWLVPAGPYMFEYLIFAQLLSGTLWACYEMGTFLLLFETIPAAERTSMLTLFNCANAAAIVTGAAVGGWLLSTFGTDHSAYMLVFLISSAARLLTVGLLTRISPPRVAPVPVPVRTIAVRPSAGSIAPPLLPGIESEAQTEELSSAH